jgi:ketosteroid isomerase-like protein
MVTIETLKEFLEAFNRHDADAIMEFFADDCIMELPRGPDPWGRRTIGKEQVRERDALAVSRGCLMFIIAMIVTSWLVTWGFQSGR